MAAPLAGPEDPLITLYVRVRPDIYAPFDVTKFVEVKLTKSSDSMITVRSASPRLHSEVHDGWDHDISLAEIFSAFEDWDATERSFLLNQENSFRVADSITCFLKACGPSSTIQVRMTSWVGPASVVTTTVPTDIMPNIPPGAADGSLVMAKIAKCALTAMSMDAEQHEVKLSAMLTMVDAWRDTKGPPSPPAPGGAAGMGIANPFLNMAMGMGHPGGMPFLMPNFGGMQYGDSDDDEEQEHDEDCPHHHHHPAGKSAAAGKAKGKGGKPASKRKR